MRQFRLRSLFLLVAVAAGVAGYAVNFTVRPATAMFNVLGPNSAKSVAEFVATPDFIRSLLDQPEVRNISMLNGREDSEAWLRQRLVVRPIRPDSEVHVVQLDWYPYLDRGDASTDFPVILDAVLKVLSREVPPTLQVHVLQTPRMP